MELNEWNRFSGNDKYKRAYISISESLYKTKHFARANDNL